MDRLTAQYCTYKLCLVSQCTDSHKVLGFFTGTTQREPELKDYAYQNNEKLDPVALNTLIDSTDIHGQKCPQYQTFGQKWVNSIYGYYVEFNTFRKKLGIGRVSLQFYNKFTFAFTRSSKLKPLCPAQDAEMYLLASATQPNRKRLVLRTRDTKPEHGDERHYWIMTFSREESKYFMRICALRNQA